MNTHGRPAPKSFDAVLAEAMNNDNVPVLRVWLNRLAAAHAAEVAEQDAAIAAAEAGWAADVSELTAKIEAEAKDAARYRWLRNAEAGALDRPFIGYRNSHGFSQFVGEYADAAIDAATGEPS